MRPMAWTESFGPRYECMYGPLVGKGLWRTNCLYSEACKERLCCWIDQKFQTMVK